MPSRKSNSLVEQWRVSPPLTRAKTAFFRMTKSMQQPVFETDKLMDEPGYLAMRDALLVQQAQGIGRILTRSQTALLFAPLMSPSKQSSNEAPTLKQSSNEAQLLKQSSNEAPTLKQSSNEVPSLRQKSDAVSLPKWEFKEVPLSFSDVKDHPSKLTGAKKRASKYAINEENGFRLVPLLKQSSNEASSLKRSSNEAQLLKQSSNEVPSLRQKSDAVSLPKWESKEVPLSFSDVKDHPSKLTGAEKRAPRYVVNEENGFRLFSPKSRKESESVYQGIDDLPGLLEDEDEESCEEDENREEESESEALDDVDENADDPDENMSDPDENADDPDENMSDPDENMSDPDENMGDLDENMSDPDENMGDLDGNMGDLVGNVSELDEKSDKTAEVSQEEQLTQYVPPRKKSRKNSPLKVNSDFKEYVHQDMHSDDMQQNTVKGQCEPNTMQCGDFSKNMLCEWSHEDSLCDAPQPETISERNTESEGEREEVEEDMQYDEQDMEIDSDSAKIGKEEQCLLNVKCGEVREDRDIMCEVSEPKIPEMLIKFRGANPDQEIQIGNQSFKVLRQLAGLCGLSKIMPGLFGNGL